MDNHQRTDFGRERPAPAVSIWGPLPSKRRVLQMVGIGLALFAAFMLLLVMTDGGSSPRSTTAGSSPIAAVDQAAIQAGLDRSLPALAAALASGGATIHGEVRKGDARVDVTVPMMSQAQAKEIALMVGQRIEAPAGTFIVVEVTSYAGQHLARHLTKR